MTRHFSKIRIVGIIVAFVTISLGLNGWAADKEAIKKQIKNQVDEVVAAIDNGKKAEDFECLSKKEPYYLFIMKPDGETLFHPQYSSISGFAYDTIIKGTTEGLWVEYILGIQMRHSYVKKTKGGLFVVSGYFD
jgi:hypothetical protein